MTSLWVWVTLGAATAQMLRFMLQKILRTGTLSTAGSTFARFVYSAPLAAALAFTYAQLTGQAWPRLESAFWGWVAVGGISQIVATMCVVAVFTERHFAVGITFAKIEVVAAVIIGFVVLGDGITWPALLAVLLGLLGVVLLSDAPAPGVPLRLRVLNRAAGLGLTSGILFAVSAVCYRGAAIGLVGDDPFLRASVTLACVTAFQTLVMLLWLQWREPGQIASVLRAWRVAGLVGVTSMLGSLGWFFAFTLQTVALVKAVGQVELLLSLIAGSLVFSEVITRREWQGMALVMLSVLALIFLA